MTFSQTYPLPKLQPLPASMPRDGMISLALVEGVSVFRASTTIQKRIMRLLEKQQTIELTTVENEELDRFEDIDDYLSQLNRVVRNLTQHKS